jgi:tRNA (guanine-N7-)-methyltransferase
MSRQRRRHRQHANPLTIIQPVAKPDWQAIFPRQAPLALDIGCGPGAFVIGLALAHPEWNVVGFEIRQFLVDDANAEIATRGLKNACVVFANVNIHLETLIDDSSVSFVSINFPDPWYKRRHHRRRVVQASWAKLLCQKLKPNAEIHVMTDYEPLSVQIQSVLMQTPGLVGGKAAQSTTGIASEREVTHTKRGEAVYRMKFTYTGSDQ